MKLIVGHYGSGKTEFALNYALEKASEGKRVLLADLDIVNPFYRSRNKSEFLEERGVTVVGSSLENGVWADIPALSPRIFALFDETFGERLADVGGDPAGARVLGRLHEKLDGHQYEMWMVVNANRPETGTADQVIRLLKEIEAVSRLKVSGLVSNTHMGDETTWEDVLAGNRLCREVSGSTGLPVRYTCISETLAGQKPEGLEGRVFVMRRLLRDIWSQGGENHV
ncbi:hypothetical protein SAMN02745168_0163 [Papillibacter cinnamivorans DSM 12816]|uniref:CobQ/CobB/MinD/ParA nucleotide binding domain-containing protein n=2 Tax=Papillibacter TaxID=100175 RepID=A0A1W2CRI7_9FIRM|nr:hypothetical protein SAMN02745168_0163 [Papillibacter cinnamivorans DSM 12816]